MAINRNREQRPRQSGAKHPIDCSRIEPMLFDYVAHELGERQSMLVREHLRRCAVCTAEAAELQQTLMVMKRNDPGVSAPSALTSKRRRRLLWLMRHPFVSRCLTHPRLTAFVVAIVILTVVFAYLLTVRYPDFIRHDLPRYPVQLEDVMRSVDSASEESEHPPAIDDPPLPNWPLMP